MWLVNCRLGTLVVWVVGMNLPVGFVDHMLWVVAFVVLLIAGLALLCALFG